MDVSSTSIQELTNDASFLTDNETMALTLNSSMNASTSNGDDLNSIDRPIAFWMRFVLIPCLALLGIAGNAFSLTVWRTDSSSFNATVFFFKALALWDTTYLALVVIYCYFKLTPWVGTALDFVLWYSGNYAQLVSVHVTLLIAVSRWIAVTFPFHAQRLMTSRRVYLSCVVVMVYCGILEGCQVVYINPHYTNMTFYLTKEYVGLVLPLLLLMMFNVSLLWTATRRPRILSQTEKQPYRNDKQNVETVLDSHDIAATHGCTEREDVTRDVEVNPGPPTQHQHQEQPKASKPTIIDQRHHTKQNSRKRYMVTAVLLVSLCSFISYPVGLSVRHYVMVKKDFPTEVKDALSYTLFVFHVLNSSLNVLIYWFFVSKFRQLAKNVCNDVRACCR